MSGDLFNVGERERFTLIWYFVLSSTGNIIHE